MGRAVRIIHADEAYHLTARGSNRGTIFIDDDDRQRFVMRLGTAAQRYEWSCLAYCLMGNHIHVVTRAPAGSIARGMRDLLGGHARHFNSRHDRSGHVFGSRFHHVHIASERQLLATLRYVALNPVRAGLVERPEEWAWSSYASLMRGVSHPGTVDTHALLALVAKEDVSPWTARQRLADHIEAGIDEARAAARIAGA